jgi:Ni,Fe-hydrogenase maturation factor
MMNSRTQTVTKPQTMLLERALRQPMMENPTFLVVGHGDGSKGDAGVGLAVARSVAAWNLPDVQAITQTVPQTASQIVSQPVPPTLNRDQSTSDLLDDLLEAIARAEYVIFVEACQGKSLYRPQITPIECDLPRIYLGFNPTALLRKVQARYGHHPQAWLLEVPAQVFDAGTELSPLAQQGLAQTLDRIAVFLRCYTPLRIAS